MFSIKAWKEGIVILNENPKMGFRELARKLDIDPFDARELIGNYRFIFDVKPNDRGGVKKEVVKTKKEINAKYYNKHIRKSPFITSNNY